MQSRAISVLEAGKSAPARAKSRNLLIEQRSAIRYCVSLRVRFRWSETLERRREAEGSTQDVSPRGAYILAPECPRVGTKLQIDFELPNELRSLRPLLLKAQGQVLRIDPSNGQFGNRGFAVQLRRTRVQTR